MPELWSRTRERYKNLGPELPKPRPAFKKVQPQPGWQLRVCLPPRPRPRPQQPRIVASDTRLLDMLSRYPEPTPLNLPLAGSRVDEAESREYWSNYFARQSVAAPVNPVVQASAPVSFAPVHGETAVSCPVVAGPGPQIMAASSVFASLASSVG